MYILFDIGGTKTRIALCRDGKTFDEPVIYQTPEDYTEGVRVFVETANKLAGGEKITAVVGGVAASFGVKKKELAGGGTQIEDWLHKPIITDFRQAFGSPVYMVNDTMMGGLAQAHLGPGKNYNIVVYITVSTGVGGARIVNGKIAQNTFGFEPGWLIIDAGNALCKGWSERGYLIDYISGMAIEKCEGKPAYEIDDPLFWEEKAKFLAYGLHNVTVMWSPDIIVVGGSIMKKIGISLERVQYYLEKTISPALSGMPILKPAEFGDEMGLYGALMYIKEYNISQEPV